MRKEKIMDKKFPFCDKFAELLSRCPTDIVYDKDEFRQSLNKQQNIMEVRGTVYVPLDLRGFESFAKENNLIIANVQLYKSWRGGTPYSMIMKVTY